MARSASVTVVQIAVALWAMLGSAQAQKGPYDWAFLDLDYARNEKIVQLKQLCDRTNALARRAAEDESVISCFDICLQYEAAVGRGAVPDTLTHIVEAMQATFADYYTDKYISFYDVLFVDLKGHIFHTLRKESDIDTNLLNGLAGESPLARCLAEFPAHETFVDFHQYEPSAEAASFFVEPIRKDGKLLGWVALQWAINKVNTVFAWNDDLGITGETFLVNHDGYMLTESNFEGCSTILKKRLDDRNIRVKFAEKEGNRTVHDYRGFDALTSFGVVQFLGAQWLVVAKIDKDEITTNYYARHPRYYADLLIEYLREQPLAPSRPSQFARLHERRRVDMDEYLRSSDSQWLETFGLATCTGLLATCARNIAYLAHISPRDRVYGETGTNLLGQMIKRIDTFDRCPDNRRCTEYTVVATHLESLPGILTKMIESGIFLSQIRVLHNSQAESAAMVYDHQDELLQVLWRMGERQTEICTHQGQDAVNLGEVLGRQFSTAEGAL